jgi:hypothetical protein
MQHTLQCTAPEQFAERVNAGTKNFVSPDRAVRVCLERANVLHVRQSPPGSWHRKPSDMTVVENRNGKELPVATANAVMLESSGFWMAQT